MNLPQSSSSLPSSPHALIYGHDVLLVKSRSWVLQYAGFMASSTVNLKQAVDMIDGGHADLLILCHPLPSQECDSILSKANPMRPGMKILILGRSRFSYHSKSDLVLDTFVSPQELISTARRLVRYCS